MCEFRARPARYRSRRTEHIHGESRNMRKSVLVLVAALIVVATPAFAELQNLTVGGAIRIRGNWWSTEAGETVNAVRWPSALIPQRAVGPTNPITSLIS